VFRLKLRFYNLTLTTFFASLGELCGLLPGNEPSSEQLHRVVELSSGIIDDHELLSPGVDLIKLCVFFFNEEAVLARAFALASIFSLV
jgi:hypothetical protein